MKSKELTGKTIRQAFIEFNKANPGVYEQFSKQALRGVYHGKKKLGAKNIIEYIRWEMSLKTTDQNFKINNNFATHYARLFVSNNPEHKDRFSFRKLRSEEPGPFMEVDKKGQINFL